MISSSYRLKHVLDSRSFNGDIIITDPFYIMKKVNPEGTEETDWDRCKYGEDMYALGFTTYLAVPTEYGHWSCTTYQLSRGELSDAVIKNEIGHFTADSEMVGVFLLSEVLSYNPDFNYHKDKPWTTTLIPNFQGDIYIVNQSGKKAEEADVRVIGTGNIDFYTKQTGM